MQEVVTGIYFGHVQKEGYPSLYLKSCSRTSNSTFQYKHQKKKSLCLSVFKYNFWTFFFFPYINNKTFNY